MFRYYEDQCIQQLFLKIIIGSLFQVQWLILFFYIRAPRATGARRPRGQNVAAIALDRRFLGTITAVFKNNTMEIIHAILTLRIVCGFLDMGDGCYLIFNKNQLMFVVRKSVTAQIKKKVILFFS